jgi:hypothetical protein
VAGLAMLVGTTVACRRPPPPPTTTTTATTAAPTTSTSTTVPRPAVQSRKISYGPFTVPNANAPGVTGDFGRFLPALGITVENGMIWNLPVKNIQKPCEDCFITGIQAGLEYTDGSNAAISNGMWLHHMVLFDSNANGSHQDATCMGTGGSAPFSLPHFAVGGTPNNTERIFASGNERATLDLTRAGSYGYKVNAGDQFHMLVDLMNMTATDRSVYLTLDYRYVSGAAAAGFKPTKPVWLDIAQCGTSEKPAQTGQYVLSSVPWKSNVTGTLLGGVGHLHDGGTHLAFDNGGQTFCDSVASYGTTPDYVDPPTGMDHGGGGMDHGSGGGTHISEMTYCAPGAALKAGDVVTIKGYYDDAQHAQMTHGGKLHPVMAIGMLYYSQ